MSSTALPPEPGAAPPPVVPPPVAPPSVVPRGGGKATEAILAKTARGAGWVVGWRLSSRLLGFVSTLLLARILTPSDFGVVAIAMSFVQAIETLSFLGVEEALVREKAPSRAMYDTGFTLNVIRNVTMALLLCAGAIPSAQFFAEPRLANVLFALAAGVAAIGFVNIGTVEYRRDFAFVMEFRMQILPRLISVALMLVVAFGLRSYWALVVGVVSMRVTAVMASYMMHPYRPRLSLRVWRSLLGYSLWTWAQTTAVVVRDRSNMFIIGRLLGPQFVGIYSVGADIALMPSTELVAPLARVAFSGFAANRNGEGDAAHTYLRVVASMALLTMPMGFGLSLTADAVVRLAFGPGWEAAIPVMRVLGVTGAVMVCAYLGSTLFFAHSQMSTCFKVTCAAALARMALLVVLIPIYGLTGAALATAASLAVETLCYVVLIARHYGLPPSALLRETWRCFAATGAMAAVLWAAGLGWTPAVGSFSVVATRLAAAVALGAVVYCAVLLGTWLASGRPAGAEADWLRVVRRAVPGRA